MDKRDYILLTAMWHIFPLCFSNCSDEDAKKDIEQQFSKNKKNE